MPKPSEPSRQAGSSPSIMRREAEERKQGSQAELLQQQLLNLPQKGPPGPASYPATKVREQRLAGAESSLQLQAHGKLDPGGEPGAVGEPGWVFVGQFGEPGPPGEHGDLGPPGIPGPPGPDGDSIIGPSGPEGSQGDRGPVGDEGEIGEVGPEGPEGPPGDQPLETEKWEQLLDNYEKTLQEMEKYGGVENKHLSQDLGLMYQHVALYHARAMMLKNNTLDLESFLENTASKLKGALLKTKKVRSDASEMTLKTDEKDLEDAERMSTIMANTKMNNQEAQAVKINCRNSSSALRPGLLATLLCLAASSLLPRLWSRLS